MEVTMKDADIAAFAGVIRGQVIRTSDAGYDDARSLYNAMIDKRPLLIVRAADVADVIAAVNFTRDNRLPLAIRGGGHNGAGLGSVDDGLLLDMSLIKGVRVDPKKGTVRVGAGCTTGDVDHATHIFGQAVPFGIISTTGVAGLTLSGGHGYLSRQHGLAVDNLIEADVVLADGSFVVASEAENADLLWALRGGGGNFGVVTSFLFRTNPATTVYGGPIAYDFADAPQVMRWYREFVATAPAELGIWLGLQTVPPVAPFPEQHWGKRTCLLLLAFAGEGGEAAANALRKTLPVPFFDWAGSMPYPTLQGMFDIFYPKGLQWYWKGDFVKDLSDAAIETHIAHAGKMNPYSLMHLYPIDGAVHQRAPGDTAWSMRDATWSMVIAGIDPDPAGASAIRDWARDYWAGIHPHNLQGGYPNFMMADEGERLKATFGPNFGRLQAIKTKYDPQNLFRMNHNIVPA
jgi:FAD/FMN-containing dehydrogenase